MLQQLGAAIKTQRTVNHINGDLQLERSGTVGLCGSRVELTASASPKNGQFGFGAQQHVWEVLTSRVWEGRGGGGRKADAVSPVDLRNEARKKRDFGLFSF